MLRRSATWFQAPKRPRRQNRFRPQVMLLEDRLAPAVFTVTTTADEINPNDGVLSLREAMAAVNVSSDLNNTIVLASGTYAIASGNHAFTVNPGKALTLVIEGQGPSNTIINGNQQDSVFLIDGNNGGVHVTYDDLQITGGKSSNNGGGIDLSDSGQSPNTDSVTLNDVLVTGNAATGNGGGIYSDKGSISLSGSIASTNTSTIGQGGGLFTGSGNISLSGSAVSGNTAAFGGGGIYNKGTNASATMSITNDSHVDDNTTIGVTGSGGGIADFSSSGTLTIDSSSVSGNIAHSGGGGVLADDATITISNSNLNNNAAQGTLSDAGALLLDNLTGGSTLTISGSIFRNDSATGNGGAVANFGARTENITGSAFNNDTANTTGGQGGAYYDNLANTTMTMSNSDVSGNKAVDDGGGYEGVNSGSSYTLTNVTFNNDAVSSSTSEGGGIFVEHAAGLTLDTVTVSGDSAVLEGGGIFSEATTLNVSNSTLVNDRVTASNGEGAGLADPSATTEQISGSIISGNIAGQGAGGLFSDATTSTIVGSAFNNDAANAQGGGGVFFDGGTLSMTNSSMVGDTAKGDGGGLDTGAVNVTLTSCVIENDTSGIDGGGVAFVNSSNSLTLDHCTISGNVATNLGGGLYVTAGAVTVEYSSFLNDAATNGGGGIEMQISFANAPLVVEYSTVAFDHATVSTASGGGLEVSGSGSGEKLEVLNSTIAGDTAGQNGGGVAIEGAGNTLAVDFLFATLDSDSATTGGGIFNAETGANLVQLGNTIVADDSAVTGPDLSGAFVDLVLQTPTVNDTIGHNIIGTTTGFTGNLSAANGDQLGVDPKLNPIANNGGPTETNSLQAGSPAVDAGKLDADVTAVTTTDQRGVTRPDGGNDNPDIGAFESNLG
jgi:CSLREA domain-containing protein